MRDLFRTFSRIGVRHHWGMRHIFRAEDLWSVVNRFGDRLSRIRLPPATGRFHRLWRSGRTASGPDWTEVSRLVTGSALRLQDRGRAYWLPRLAELRRLRMAGRLIPEGTPVGKLI